MVATHLLLNATQKHLSGSRRLLGSIVHEQEKSTLGLFEGLHHALARWAPGRRRLSNLRVAVLA